MSEASIEEQHGDKWRLPPEAMDMLRFVKDTVSGLATKVDNLEREVAGLRVTRKTIEKKHTKKLSVDKKLSVKTPVEDDDSEVDIDMKEPWGGAVVPRR